MAKQESKMICPKCGDEMNHHADKLVYPTLGEEAEKMTRWAASSRKPTVVQAAVLQGEGILVCTAHFLRNGDEIVLRTYNGPFVSIASWDSASFAIEAFLWR